MHADLVKLLDLQAKDSAVAEVERRMGALREETGVLDQALNRAREGLAAAKRAATSSRGAVCVRARSRETFAWPKRITYVRMLHDELQRDGEAEHHGDRNRHADQNERECADHDVKRLVHRVADEAIEAVEAMYPMM